MSYRLKDVRIDNDLTQKNLAQQLQVSRSTYSGWENEGDNIPLYQFNNFCEIFIFSTLNNNSINNKVTRKYVKFYYFRYIKFHFNLQQSHFLTINC